MQAFFLFILVAALTAVAAEACPPSLAKLATTHLDSESLCEVYDRYQRAVESLRSQGVSEPERLANVIGPRLVNRPRWLDTRGRLRFDPRSVYSPAPLTWRSWENGAALVEASAKRFREHGGPLLTLEWVKKLHRETMGALLTNAGELRQMGEVGLALERGAAVTPRLIEDLRNGGGYRRIGDETTPLYSWHATECTEDKSAQDAAEHARINERDGYIHLELWKHLEEDQFFTAADGRRKQCGYIRYPDSFEIKPNLDAWAEEINSLTARWPGGDASEDPLITIARAQRKFIGIHPFLDGNGRTSRLIMDLLVKSLDLPAPVLVNMDLDIYSSESAWATEIGRGIARAVNITEGCARDLSRPGCQVIDPRTESQK